MPIVAQVAVRLNGGGSSAFAPRPTAAAALLLGTTNRPADCPHLSTAMRLVLSAYALSPAKFLIAFPIMKKQSAPTSPWQLEAAEAVQLFRLSCAPPRAIR